MLSISAVFGKFWLDRVLECWRPHLGEILDPLLTLTILRSFSEKLTNLYVGPPSPATGGLALVDCLTNLSGAVCKILSRLFDVVTTLPVRTQVQPLHGTAISERCTHVSYLKITVQER